MPDETTPPSFEDLARRVLALEGSSKQHTDLLNELAIETGQNFKQLKETIAAAKRLDVVLPPAGGTAGARPGAAPATSTKKDAWGNPLDAAGKIIPAPPAQAPAPARSAGEAPACSCSGHDPAHGPKGCTVKGCSCVLTA